VRQLSVPAPPCRRLPPGGECQPIQLLQHAEHFVRARVETPATTMNLQHDKPPKRNMETFSVARRDRKILGKQTAKTLHEPAAIAR
jgi:hypothetical protein